MTGAASSRAASEKSFRVERVRGQDSFLLKGRLVNLALTSLGGMMGPVTFFPEESHPVQPYAVAPWAEEDIPADTPAMLRALRGDWFCSAFGENGEPHLGRMLPPHGETANRTWYPVAQGESSSGSWIRLATEMPLQGGRCVATTAVLHEHSMVYQRRDLEGLTGPINPGHHATLAFPNRPGVARLSFSPHVHAHSLIEPIVKARAGRGSSLLPDCTISRLRAATCVDGSTTDLTFYPARPGCDDIAIVCADASLPFAWSAATCASLGYVWFALRNPRQLASTLLWFSNGGQESPPWNGRHVNVLGIEDITAFFDSGIAASCRPNMLSEQRIRTHLNPVGGRLSIPYIQGAARIPPEFNRVATIEAVDGGEAIVLRSDTGRQIRVGCRIDFLSTGKLPGIRFAP